MASLLATLVLDQEAMAALQARGEAPPMFRTTLSQLAKALGRVKASNAAASAAGGALASCDGGGAAGSGAVPTSMRCSSAGHDEYRGGYPRWCCGRRTTPCPLLCDVHTANARRRPPAAAALAARAEAGPSAAVLPRETLAAVVSLADACAQGMWGSAHYCLSEPLQITQARRRARGHYCC